MDNTHLPNTTREVRAFVAEDSAAIRERLVALLAEGGEISVVGEANTADSAIKAILALHPDVVTLDIHLRDSSGLRVIHEVRKLAPDVEFVVLTNHPDPFYRRAFTQKGARCFLDKNSEFGRVKQQVLAACSGTHGASAQLQPIY